MVAKATPVENVLLHALGLVPADLVPHEDDVQELNELFDTPLRDQHVCIIAALFGKTVPFSGWETGLGMEIKAM